MRGKKYTDEIKEQAYLMYATCGSYAETARNLGIAKSTVKGWIDKKEPDEFEQLRSQKKMEFADKAGEVINIALQRLLGDLKDGEKDIPVNHLTTVIGTMYDKRALARGESTESSDIKVTIKVV